MKKKFKMLVVGMSISLVVVTLVCYLSVSKQHKSMAQEVNGICEEISEDVASMSEVSPTVAMSSNPYDYIENCEAYDRLVDLGEKAIPEIGKLIVNKADGLNGYILAAAIEDIAGCDVYKETGIDWCNGLEFVDAWNKMVKKSSQSVKRGGGESNNLIIPVNEKTKNEKNKNINYSFFYKRILCRDCGKASFDKNFLDNYGNYRQYGIDFCKYHMEMTSFEAEFVETGYTDNNCLAYAVGDISPCNWMWPKSWSFTPSPEVVKEYFQGDGYTTEDYNKANISLYKEKKAIFVYAVKNKNKKLEVVHFGRADILNGEVPKDYEVVSKWGMGAVYKTKKVNSFIKDSGYGKCVFVCYK